ncbi:unnamed protein product [Lampetra planeri]
MLPFKFSEQKLVASERAAKLGRDTATGNERATALVQEEEEAVTSRRDEGGMRSGLLSLRQFTSEYAPRGAACTHDPQWRQRLALGPRLSESHVNGAASAESRSASLNYAARDRFGAERAVD